MEALKKNNINRLPGLDFLRALAIIMVLLSHFSKKTPILFFKKVGSYGWAGSDLFFVLSGYLICGQLLRSMRVKGGIHFRSFYRRRALRILPAFYVILLAYFVWPWCREDVWTVPVWRFLTFTQNFGLQSGAFSFAWSLCVEEQFYLLFPALVTIARGTQRLVVPLLLAVVFAGMIYRGTMWSHLLQSQLTEEKLKVAYFEYIYYPTFSHFDSLVAGVSAALIQNCLPATWSKIQKYGNSLCFAGLAFVTLVLVCFEFDYSAAAVALRFPLLAFGFGLIVMSAAGEQGLLSIKRLPGAGFLATISYSIYLTHLQTMHVVADEFHKHGRDNQPFLLAGSTFAAILAVGYLLYVMVELPCLKLRDRWDGKMRGAT